MVNDRMKGAERGCARAAEQVFRTSELIQSGSVAESVEVCNKVIHLLRCKRHIVELMCVTGKDR